MAGDILIVRTLIMKYVANLTCILNYQHSISIYFQFLAPAVTVVETEGAMDSVFDRVFTSSFAYNFVRR